MSEGVAEWWAHRKAGNEADTLLGFLQPAQPGTLKEAQIPMEKVVRILEDAEYRLIRNAADLQAVVVEQIEALATDAQEHLSMLYLPRKKKGQQRLDEDALQAYIYCRLKDRLPNRVLEPSTTIILNREPLGAKDQRFDIKAEAPTIAGTRAAVVIEIKWSDNREVSIALKEQLGQRYLTGGELTHGIFFIGWCKHGIWKTEAGPRPKPRDSIDAWKTQFARQAREFCDTTPNRSIVSIVMNFVWAAAV